MMESYEISELDFQEARAVFMIRYLPYLLQDRMLRTKSNFSGRWMGIQCNVCALEDTDIHIFKCPGYIITDEIDYEMFWKEKIIEDMET